VALVIAAPGMRRVFVSRKGVWGRGFAGLGDTSARVKEPDPSPPLRKY
jgi:hypothetical protein